jgi:hypothetical protein
VIAAARSFTVHDVEQGSPEWLQLRTGKLCASQAGAMFDTLKGGGPGYKRRDLLARLVVERLTGRPAEDGYVSADMQRGKDLEPDARAAYEGETGNLVRTVGFISHESLSLPLPIGYSPDGIIGDFDGLLELKVPKAATHMRYLKDGRLPEDYRGQVMHALLITGAPFLDFCSYGPEFPERLQLFRVRVQPNDFDLMVYRRQLESFLAEVEAEYQTMLKIGTVAA